MSHAASQDPADHDDNRLARRNALFLAAATALAGANASVIFATGAITGARMAPDPAYATAPVSIFVVGMASGTLPVGYIARRYGRKATFVLGTLCGMLMGLIACAAVVTNSFALYCMATFFGGLYGSVAQSFRFAAADTATPKFRPKAISWVMAGGVFAGVLGPQLVSVTMNLWDPHLFAASYLAQAVVAFVAMIVLLQVKAAPAISVVDEKKARPLGEITRQSRFIVAAICGVASYGLMNLVMTSAPLAMKMCGHSLHDSNLAIQWHVMAMYGPSFFTGSLISRFGASKVIAAGLGLLAAAAVVDIAGNDVAHFWLGLILLGVGWNFGFVGATAMVAETHHPSERNKVQAFNDFLIFGTMAVGSFSSGKILTDFGWESVNHVVFPPVLIGLVALFWLTRRHRKLAH
jgi:MFS family permease